MDPTFKQLRYLVTLADAGSFRKAAEQCGISQPSLSVQIANLEGLLGLTLVSRGRGQTTLTVAGRDVVRHARRIADEIAALKDRAARAEDGLTGTVRLGASPTLAPYLLPPVVARLRSAFPDLKLYVREAPPRQLADDLAIGAHDMILSQLPVGGADATVTRLFREPLLATMASDHPLADRRQLTEADLAGVDLLSLGPGYTLHDQVLGLARDHGAHVLRDYEGTSLDALRAMTAMGMGLSLLPALYVRSEIAPRSDPLAVVAFAGGRVHRTVGLVMRRNSGNERAFRALAGVVRDAVREMRTAGVMLLSE